MNDNVKKETWSENVILVDGDYIDRVAFDLTVNFERMLERRIPQADLARWLECLALDGGIREEQGTSDNQVILLHSKTKGRLENFIPGSYTDELDGQAFSGNLGEFCLSAVPVEEMTTMEDLFAESLQHICQQPEIKRLMVVGDDRYYHRIRGILDSKHSFSSEGDGERFTTVFTMQPMSGGRFQQEILGYSLLAALGIKSAELTEAGS